MLSGGGTTLQNLLDERAAGRLPIDVVRVLASRPGIRGIERAGQAGIPVDVVTRKSFPNTEAYSERLFAACREAGAKLVCLAGFLQLLRIPDDFTHKVLNIHPSLLPAFGGKGMYGHHVHEAVLAFGAKVSGCTVHFADNEFDQGPIVMQQAVPVLDDDTPDTLAARVFTAECAIYPEAIRRFAEERLEFDCRRVLTRS